MKVLGSVSSQVLIAFSFSVLLQFSSFKILLDVEIQILLEFYGAPGSIQEASQRLSLSELAAATWKGRICCDVGCWLLFVAVS